MPSSMSPPTFQAPLMPRAEETYNIPGMHTHERTRVSTHMCEPPQDIFNTRTRISCGSHFGSCWQALFHDCKYADGGRWRPTLFFKCVVNRVTMPSALSSLSRSSSLSSRHTCPHDKASAFRGCTRKLHIIRTSPRTNSQVYRKNTTLNPYSLFSTLCRAVILRAVG